MWNLLKYFFIAYKSYSSLLAKTTKTHVNCTKSLYGSTTWIEDFAEAFTWYYLNKNYGINYITLLLENDTTLISYNPNENGLVKNRYKIFEKILE